MQTKKFSLDVINLLIIVRLKTFDWWCMYLLNAFIKGTYTVSTLQHQSNITANQKREGAEPLSLDPICTCNETDTFII